ncbi:MAG TPA: hypothetical protein VLG36_03935 [Candidatus Chromulinivoraceae bacterium]|nr:hypothetical protein [Candidatus Chromulinivoraceae bacterium]
MPDDEYSYTSGTSQFEIIYSISKEYPHKTKHVVYHKPYLIPDKTMIIPGKKKKRATNKTSDFQKIDRSLRRAKSEIQDIVLCNKFDMFATFTFNGDTKNVDKFGYTVHDRQNPSELKNVMSNWLKSQQKQHGRFDYVIVPEYHKDGKSIHFHALFYGYNGMLTDGGIQDKGQTVWNIASYKAGHSTVKMIRQTSDDIGRIGSYVTKYITKDMPLFAGKKRYWCSRGFARPTKGHNLPLPAVDLFTHTYKTEFYTIYEFPKIG